MTVSQQLAIILMADDDADDRLLVKEALTESHMNAEFHFVEDGEELMNYLCRCGKHQDKSEIPLPSLILLDLNMPKKAGSEALHEIRQNPSLRRIPVVMFTTSQAPGDIECSYDRGANSYFVKPVTFEHLVEMINTMHYYWFETGMLSDSQARTMTG